MGVNKKQRSCDRRGGAQRPVWHVNDSKKTGARSARARTRGQNPLVIDNVLVVVVLMAMILSLLLQIMMMMMRIMSVMMIMMTVIMTMKVPKGGIQIDDQADRQLSKCSLTAWTSL